MSLNPFKSTTDSLIGASGNIVSVFTKTLTSLTDNTKKLVAHDNVLNTRQAEIQIQRDALAKTKATNEKMSSKIEEFLGVEEVKESTTTIGPE